MRKDEQFQEWGQKEMKSNPMLNLAAQIREQTCGLCRVGPGPFGFGVCTEQISQVGIVIRMTPTLEDQSDLIPEAEYTAFVEAIFHLNAPPYQSIGADELEKLSQSADAASRLVAKAALKLGDTPITITGQEYSDAFDALAQLEQLGLDSGISESEAKRLDWLGWYKGKTPEEIASFQLFEKRLCMPFDQFHAAVEAALSRPVWSHEFMELSRLQEEFRIKLQQEETAQIMTL